MYLHIVVCHLFSLVKCFAQVEKYINRRWLIFNVKQIDKTTNIFINALNALFPLTFVSTLCIQFAETI